MQKYTPALFFVPRYLDIWPKNKWVSWTHGGTFLCQVWSSCIGFWDIDERKHQFKPYTHNCHRHGLQVGILAFNELAVKLYTAKRILGTLLILPVTSYSWQHSCDGPFSTCSDSLCLAYFLFLTLPTPGFARRLLTSSAFEYLLFHAIQIWTLLLPSLILLLSYF